jgi:hypothetical protein
MVLDLLGCVPTLALLSSILAALDRVPPPPKLATLPALDRAGLAKLDILVRRDLGPLPYPLPFSSLEHVLLNLRRP